MRKNLTKEAIREHQMAKTGGTQTDLFTCGKCKKKNCTYTQVCGWLWSHVTVRMFHSCFRVKIITEPDIVQEKYFLGRFQLIKDKLIYSCANENIYYKNCISSIETQMYYNGQLISSCWLLYHSKQDHLVKGSSLSHGLCANRCLFLFIT